MKYTLHEDKAAYKWARKREAEILHQRRILRRSAYILAHVRRDLAYLALLARQWRARAACFEREEHLGLPD